MPTPIRTKFLETVVLDIDFSSHTLQSFMHSFPSRCITSCNHGWHSISHCSYVSRYGIASKLVSWQLFQVSPTEPQKEKKHIPQLPCNETMQQEVIHYLPIPLAHTTLAHQNNVSLPLVIHCKDFPQRTNPDKQCNFFRTLGFQMLFHGKFSTLVAEYYKYFFLINNVRKLLLIKRLPSTEYYKYEW